MHAYYGATNESFLSVPRTRLYLRFKHSFRTFITFVMRT